MQSKDGVIRMPRRQIFFSSSSLPRLKPVATSLLLHKTTELPNYKITAGLSNPDLIALLTLDLPRREFRSAPLLSSFPASTETAVPTQSPKSYGQLRPIREFPASFVSNHVYRRTVA